MDYKASLDTLAKIITTGVFVLLLVLGYRSVKTLLAAHGDVTTILIHTGILLLFIAIIGGSYIYSPQKYVVTNDSFVIKRMIGDVKIDLGDIDEVRMVEASEMASAVRTFGVGGLFGYFGKFHSPGLGHVSMYATNRNEKVLIKTKQGKKIIITPDDKDLVAELNKKISF